MSKGKPILVKTSDLAAVRDRLSKSRAISISQKQKKTPTLDVYGNSYRSFKKGFDAAVAIFTEREKILCEAIELMYGSLDWCTCQSLHSKRLRDISEILESIDIRCDVCVRE